MYATGTVQATGNILGYGTLNSGTSSPVAGRNSLTGDVLISGNITSLTVTGNAFATSNVYATGTVQATGNILGYGTLNSGTSSPVAGRNSLTGNVLISGNITSVANVTATGTVTVVNASTTRQSISENLMVNGMATTTGSSGQFATQGFIGAGGTSTPATEISASGAATTTLYLHSTGTAGGCIQLESSTSTVYRIYIGEDTGGSTELVIEAGTCK
ncbi:MAG: hypothetical protein HYU35_03210 [Parcubacteria group bacterium]|nr:hypothetical protein [Parcubacteria group bacterium]